MIDKYHIGKDKTAEWKLEPSTNRTVGSKAQNIISWLLGIIAKAKRESVEAWKIY